MPQSETYRLATTRYLTRRTGRVRNLTRTIHDYFLAKCVDVVRPGGVVALITSRYTMDKQDSSVRRHLAENSALLGAIRLPNTTFRANAGTDVTTDILFLQKRPSPQREHEETWADLGQIESADGPLQINEYFIRHPEMMLGRMANDTGRYGTPTAFLEGDFEPQALAGAISRLPTGVYSEAQRQQFSPSPEKSEDIEAVGEVKDGGLTERNGEIFVRRGNALEALAFPPSTSARIRGMLHVRDAVREVFRSQLADKVDDAAIVKARTNLNWTYDSFVARFGPLSTRENVRAFADDPDQPLLLSLEEFDPETRKAAKSAIFVRQTLERYRPVEAVETAPEALLVSLNETGQINWQRMERLTGRSSSELQIELGGLAYRNPEGGTWETADRYLSGNVRTKLAVAQMSAQLDPAYERNVEALRAVQPRDLEPGEIEARLGSTWIPRSDVRAFLAELLDVPPDSVKIAFAESIATWTVEPDYQRQVRRQQHDRPWNLPVPRDRVDGTGFEWAYAHSIRRRRRGQQGCESA